MRVHAQTPRSAAPDSRLRSITGPHGLRLWLALLFVGSAALGLWFLVKPMFGPGHYYQPGFARSAYEYAQPIAFLFVPWALALWAWRRGDRVSMRWLIGGAVLLHVLVLFAPLPQSQDFYQYLFYGKMQAVHGANPYVAHPSMFRDDSWYVWIRWWDQPSVYGPAWTLVTFAIAKVFGGSLTVSFVALKLVILALDLSVMAMIVAAARGRSADGRDRPGHAGWGIVAYAWNPLVMICVPLAGANDVAIAAALVGAHLARRRGRTWMATLLLTLAALVKAYAAIGLILHLVLLLRERGSKEAARQGLLAGAVATVAYAPYWAGWATFRGLANIAEMTNLSLSGMTSRLIVSPLEALGVPAGPTVDAVLRLAGGALLAAAVVWAVRRTRDEASLWYGVLFVVATYLFVTPWFFYWYIVAPVALVAALPRNRLTTPVLVFSGSSLIVLHYHPVLLNWTVQTALRYGLPVWAFLRGSGRTIREPEASGAVPEPPAANAATPAPPGPATPSPAAVGD
jgi:alpha-1,6-mannosyltransferase